MRKILLTLMAAFTFLAQNAFGEKLENGTYSFPGEYVFTLGDDYDSDRLKTDVEIKATITYDALKDVYTIKEQGTSYLPYDVKCKFDASTNKVTFNEDIADPMNFTAFWPFSYTYDMTRLESWSVDFDPATGSIEFPEKDFGFCWGDYMNQSDFMDYEARYDVKGAVQSDGNGEGDEGSSWTDLGNALFMDGWVLPFLGIDQTKEENIYEVLVQQNSENQNLYRLVNPYKTGPAAAYNTHSNKEGYIEFDVTDPAHVVFNKVASGFAYDDSFDYNRRFNELYCLNQLGYYILRWPDSEKSSLISTMTMQKMPFTVYDPETRTISLGDNGQTRYDQVYDANVGTDQQNKTNGGTCWQDEDGMFINMTAKIVLPGGSIETDPDIEDPKGDDEPTEAPTYVGSVSAVHSQTLEGVTKEYPFTFDYEITYNADKTLTLGGHFTFTDGEPVAYDGSSLMIIFPGGYVNNEANQTDLFTTTGYTYEEGQTVDIQFANAVAAGRVEANVKYVVGSVSEGSDQPGGELPTSGKYNGNVSADLDETQGMMEEPQLIHADWTVTADFDADSNTLTIYNLAESEYPIVFDVDVTAGTLKSKGAQLSNKEEIDEDMTFEYYYADFKSKSYDVNGTFKNADGNCEISLNPWGEALPDYDFFFNTLWYNTVITIEDLTIGQPGGNDEPAEGNITGNMVYQVDMNMGQKDEPDLAEPDDCQVTASYDADSKTLVIYGMFDGLNPLKLTVDPAAGTFSGAVPQISSVDDYEPDYILTYYYIDFNNHDLAASGTIANVNDKCVLEFAPLGECMPEYDYFFNFLWYNTVVTLDFNIPGAEEKEEKGDITGNMVYQVDMNMGTGDEPDLTEPEEVTVTASYDAESGKLTIYNFAEMNPVVFDVNVTAGTIFADEQQVAYTESFEGQDFIYYYGDVTSMEQGMNGTIRNISETQCELRVDPWGEAMAYAGSVFFNTAFYNTVVILDLNIDGLAYKPQISITEEGVTAEVTDSGVVLTIPYDEKYLPLNPTIYAEVKIKGSEEMNVYPVTANPGVITVQGLDAGYYVFEIILVVEDGGKNKVAESDVFETSVVTVETGIDAVGADKETVRYFNLQGIEIAAPEKGTFVKVQGNKATKVLVK